MKVKGQPIIINNIDFNQVLEIERFILHQEIDRKFEEHKIHQATLYLWKQCGIMIKRYESKITMPRLPRR
jgi:hypothetical protein